MNGQITIQGLTFNTPRPYAEGYTLKSNEADALNNLLGENLRNNFRQRVLDAKEKGELDHAALQAEFDAKAAEYEFGARRGGGGTAQPKDPVEREAYAIAREKIKARAKQLNRTVDAETINEMIPGLLEKYPEIRTQAQQIVATRQSVSIEELELPEEEEVEEEAEEDAEVEEAEEEVEEAPAPRGRRGR